jgi:hypothetical protein
MATNLIYSTQNQLLLNNLTEYYSKHNRLETILPIINGTSELSIRIIDWFVTNYSKQYYTVYPIQNIDNNTIRRFKVYTDYKLKLKAYSKRRFDPFCRWERIYVPYKDNTHVQTTLGQLNFFKWALENEIIKYIQTNLHVIEQDMLERNSNSKKKIKIKEEKNKTRKRREELSISAVKSIKKEDVEIVVRFN